MREHPRTPAVSARSHERENSLTFPFGEKTVAEGRVTETRHITGLDQCLPPRARRFAPSPICSESKDPEPARVPAGHRMPSQVRRGHGCGRTGGADTSKAARRLFRPVEEIVGFATFPRRPPYVLLHRSENLFVFFGFLSLFVGDMLWFHIPGFGRGRKGVGVPPETTIWYRTIRPPPASLS